jgi:hypothetical protein
MNDLAQLKKDYVEARREICTHTMGSVFDLTLTVNYYKEQIENKPQAFRKYITAHRSLADREIPRRWPFTTS